MERVSGALSALVAKGLQDDYLFNAAHEDTWDVRRKFLRAQGEPYTTVYTQLGTTFEVSGRTTSFTLDACANKMADMVNDLDLVITTDEEDLGKIIRKVEVRIGDRRIDAWDGTDIDTLIRTMCEVFGRKISRHGSGANSRLFVPLALAPFHSHNLLSLVGTRDTKVVIVVELAPETGMWALPETPSPKMQVEVYGRAYFLSLCTRALATDYTMGIADTQWGGDHPMPKYITYTRHSLSFAHPVSMLMFWGVDKNTIQTIQVTLNGRAIYDGPLAPLERVKEERGLGHVEPVMMFFSLEAPDRPSPYRSTVNCSKIDHLAVFINRSHQQGEAREDGVVRYYALAANLLCTAKGHCGKIFADERSTDMFPGSCGDYIGEID